MILILSGIAQRRGALPKKRPPYKTSPSCIVSYGEKCKCRCRLAALKWSLRSACQTHRSLLLKTDRCQLKLLKQRFWIARTLCRIMVIANVWLGKVMIIFIFSITNLVKNKLQSNVFLLFLCVPSSDLVCGGFLYTRIISTSNHHHIE